MKKSSLKVLKIFGLTIILIIIGTGLLYAQTRIMALGDSITGSPGCWRAYLWQSLTKNGYTNINFVGTQYPQGCGFNYDGEHEGHGGALATNVADQNQLVDWLSQSNPDIVLMHFGTNDCWSGRDNQVILDAFSKLVDQMRSNNPNMIIFVAQIIPMDPSQSCVDCDQRVITLNNSLPAWAQTKNTSQSPIIIVDHWTGFDVNTDTYDGVHPNEQGDRKIAANWYDALTPILTGSPTDTPIPSPTPVDTPTPTSTPTLTNLGDTNNDGSINIIDALLVAQYYVGLDPDNFYIDYADVNCDENVNIVDALIIAQYYVGLITGFECYTPYY